MGHKVDSLLFELSVPALETWLLPQSEMLCVFRYQGTNLEEATVRDGHQEHEEDPLAPERVVFPPASGTTPTNGTTAPHCRSTRQIPMFAWPGSSTTAKSKWHYHRQVVLPPDVRYYRPACA